MVAGMNMRAIFALLVLVQVLIVFAKKSDSYKRNLKQDDLPLAELSKAKELSKYAENFHFKLDNNRRFGNVTSAKRRCSGKNCLSNVTTSMLLFTKRGTGSNYQAVLTRDSNGIQFKNSTFDPSNPTVVIIHGWMGEGIKQELWARSTKDLILARGQRNVFFADWNHKARSPIYTRVVKQMDGIASDIITVLRKLNKVFPEFVIEDVHAIGFSLGAHIAGLMGQMLNRKLKHITVLGLYPIQLASFRVKLHNSCANLRERPFKVRSRRYHSDALAREQKADHGRRQVH